MIEQRLAYRCDKCFVVSEDSSPWDSRKTMEGLWLSDLRTILRRKGWKIVGQKSLCPKCREGRDP